MQLTREQVASAPLIPEILLADYWQPCAISNLTFTEGAFYAQAPHKLTQDQMRLFATLPEASDYCEGKNRAVIHDRMAGRG